MGTSPIFGTTPALGVARLTTGVATRDGSGTESTVLAAGASGTKIEKIVVKAETDLADSVVNIWINDGSTDFLFDEFDAGDPATASTTVSGYREVRYYRDFTLPTGFSLKATITVTPTTGGCNVFAMGSHL